MTKYFQHISDDSTFHLTEDGQSVEDVDIEATGSPIGRVLFTDWSPMIKVEASVKCSIKNSIFTGGSMAVHIGI